MLRVQPDGERAVRIWTAVVAGAAIATAVACGARAPLHDDRPRSPDQAQPLPPVDDVRGRIEALAAAIDADRTRLGDDPPGDAAATAMSDIAAGDVAQACTRSPRQRCTDVCTLGDSICDNATAICDLAAQLPGDAWAEGKCNEAKASCKTASERCCTCS